MADGQTVSFGGYSISDLGRVNVLLGKNGCGKSTVLREMYRYVVQGPQGELWTQAKYVTPERAGSLVYNPNTETNIANNPTWLTDTRLVNQFNDFKQQTMAQYRQLEIAVSRLFQAAHKAGQAVPPYFSDYADRINQLLDNVELREEGMTFKIYSRQQTDLEIQPANISSGESELIALAIEILVFATAVSGDKRGLLLLDEPDVHLHPDLQARLIKFLVALVQEFEFDLLIATHSTPILGELAADSGMNVCFMHARENNLVFRSVDSIYRELLPVFGAHPLTQIFNATRTLLVEGDDDVRIWQEAVRGSNGALNLMPVGCEGTSDMHSYEERMQEIVSTVYDDGHAYSLRDRDDKPEEIEDMPPVIRMRLSCRNAENLMLSDEVLESVGIDWREAQERITAWCTSYEKHGYLSQMEAFAAEGFKRKDADLKDIRMILLGDVLQSKKPWEVLVGKAIGKLTEDSPKSDDSLRTYLGTKTVQTLLELT
jgi:ABC-type cobalamin/Fe3+-siderophores transport system ATPase subunit